jgi:hypothetical protein
VVKGAGHSSSLARKRRNRHSTVTTGNSKPTPEKGCRNMLAYGKNRVKYSRKVFVCVKKDRAEVKDK